MAREQSTTHFALWESSKKSPLTGLATRKLQPAQTSTLNWQTDLVNARASSWVVALVAFAVAIAGATWWTIDRGQDQNPSWLFSHTASAGTLLRQSDGDYTLTLTGIDPHVMAFTDRPVRDSVIVPATDLITAWPGLFVDSPPNAVLVEHNAKGNTDSVVLTLTNPRLATPAAANSTSADTATLTFDAKLITTEHPSNLKRLTRGIHKTPPATFANASLFIDDVDVMTVSPTGPIATWQFKCQAMRLC